MKTIKSFLIISLLAISGLYAQEDNWVGVWNTKFGKLVIKKNGDQYTGTFPKGRLTQGREQDGMLIGRYTRATPRHIKNSLGKKGEYRFILSQDKKKFDGYHKSETDTKWGSENWNGEKIVYQLVGPPVVTPINILVSEEYIWTGTWNTDKLGTLKVLVTDKHHVNGKYSYNNKKNYGDIKGSLGIVNAFNDPKWFTGTITTEKNVTGEIRFHIYEDKFTGYIRWNDGRTNALGMPTPGTTTTVTATRLSAAQPDMTSYP